LALSLAETEQHRLRLSELEACLAESEACRVIPESELRRLAASDSQVAITYYGQLTSGMRLPDGASDRLRRIADTILFTGYSEEISFAAITVDDRWMKSYGDAAIYFKEESIAHRASVFEGNSMRWIHDQAYSERAPVGSLSKNTLEIPPGYRATWDWRHKLGVAKLATDLREPHRTIADCVLSEAPEPSENRFIEVHIFGTFSIRSVKRIRVLSDALSPNGRKALEETAERLSIELIIQ